MNNTFIDLNGIEWILTADGHWLNTSNPKEVITEYELRTRYPMQEKKSHTKRD